MKNSMNAGFEGLRKVVADAEPAAGEPISNEAAIKALQVGLKEGLKDEPRRGHKPSNRG